MIKDQNSLIKELKEMIDRLGEENRCKTRW